MTEPTPFQPDPRFRDLFIDWIEHFDIRHAQNRAKLYKNDPEAPMCEATFGGVLTDCEVDVEPNAEQESEPPSEGIDPELQKELRGLGYGMPTPSLTNCWTNTSGFPPKSEPNCC